MQHVGDNGVHVKKQGSNAYHNVKQRVSIKELQLRYIVFEEIMHIVEFTKTIQISRFEERHNTHTRTSPCESY